MTDPRVRTVFLGSGGFGREALRRLADHRDIRLAGVVTAPPRPVGRRQVVTPTAIGEVAASLGTGPVLTPERLRDADAVAAVLSLEPDLVVLADYGQIVPAALLDRRHGALNLHPSLLPRHRGATPIPAAILAGDRETGVTLMRMDAGLDTGPIVAQTTFPLAGTETAPGLETALEGVAADLLEHELGPWVRGERTARPQDPAGVTMTRPLRREDGRLDPDRPAFELERRIRAHQPWPGSFVETVAGRLGILAGVAAPDDGPGGAASGAPAGRFHAAGLSTADGTLRLAMVQPAGGRPMPWEAFLRGHPEVLGSDVVRGG